MNKFTKDNIREEIQSDIDSFNIRELILDSAPPFEWVSNKNHPIHQLGSYYFGIGDGFKFNEAKVNEADELMLWKIYGLIKLFWDKALQQSANRQNVISHMNSIRIKDGDVGKKVLKLFEEYYDWR